MTRTVAQCRFNDLKWILQMLSVEVQFLRDSIAIVSGNFMVWGKKEYLYDAWVFFVRNLQYRKGAQCALHLVKQSDSFFLLGHEKIIVGFP